MDLRDFITETLIAIQEGVLEAINRPVENGTVNPVFNVEGEKVDWRDYVKPVEFDVAVSATDKAGTTGKAGIKILTFAEAGGEGSASTERSTISRIKFSIPIIPPLCGIDRYPKDAKGDIVKRQIV